MLEATRDLPPPAGHAVGEAIKRMAHGHSGRGGWLRDTRRTGDKFDVVPPRSQRRAERVVVRARLAARVNDDDAHHGDGTRSPARAGASGRWALFPSDAAINFALVPGTKANLDANQADR
jgi:hypothetical protein